MLARERAGRDGAERPPSAPRRPTPAIARAARARRRGQRVNQLVIEAMLGKRGFAVDVAADGARGARAARPARTTRGLHGLPDARASTATRRPRGSAPARPAGARVPIVAMTAHAMAATASAASPPAWTTTSPSRCAPRARRRARALARASPRTDGAAERPGRSSTRRACAASASTTGDRRPARRPCSVRRRRRCSSELRDAVERRRRGARAALAHKLKGSCQNVGATFMATLSSSLERGDAAPRASRRFELEAAYAPHARRALAAGRAGRGVPSRDRERAHVPIEGHEDADALVRRRARRPAHRGAPPGTGRGWFTQDLPEGSGSFASCP